MDCLIHQTLSQVYKLTVTRESSKDYTWGGQMVEV